MAERLKDKHGTPEPTGQTPAEQENYMPVLISGLLEQLNNLRPGENLDEEYFSERAEEAANLLQEAAKEFKKTEIKLRILLLLWQRRLDADFNRCPSDELRRSLESLFQDEDIEITRINNIFPEDEGIPKEWVVNLGRWLVWINYIKNKDSSSGHSRKWVCYYRVINEGGNLP